MALWVINHQMQPCPVDKIYNSFLNAGHVRKEPRNNRARFFKPDGEEPAEEVHHLRLEYKSSQDAHFPKGYCRNKNLSFDTAWSN